MEKKTLALLCPEKWHYELSTLVREVYPFATVTEEASDGLESIRLSEDGRHGCFFSADKTLAAEVRSDSEFVFPGEDAKNHAKVVLYKLLTEELPNRSLPWGILTGVRPSKVAYAFLEEGKNERETSDILEREYCLRRDKAELTAKVASHERALLSDHEGTDISLYIGIPFCPTRCSYCSFISNDSRAYKKFGDDYVESLLREIAFCGELIRGRRIQSFYMGGGTPTTLSALQLDRILSAAEDAFGLSALREVTVEAGRPDTITREKLKVLKAHGVGRLSVNPQTMHQETLDAIGRRHTVEQIYEAMALAREEGFGLINMDFILGLPGESAEHVRRSMEAVKRLHPENLTVHTLAVKRASRLNENGDIPDLTGVTEELERMIAITAETASELGLEPYYMYRQKNMAGNFENVGYSLPGKECLYNIEIMEERQNILAMGAGGVSKVYFPAENRLERVPNVKTADEYIRRLPEMLEKKRCGGIALEG